MSFSKAGSPAHQKIGTVGRKGFGIASTKLEDFCHLLTALITDSMRIYRTKIVLEQLLLSNYNLISDIYHQRTMEDAEHLFFQVILTLFAHLKGNTTGFHTRIIQETIEYINLHYQEKV